MVTSNNTSTGPDGIEAYFGALQEQLTADLGVPAVMDHPVAKGDEAEANWVAMLENHLPRRYQVIPKCYVVDHKGSVSHEIDLALCDRQYSTLVLSTKSRQYVPAEAVYGVFEVKQRLEKRYVEAAADKAASVRILERTSASIVDARGRIEQPKDPLPIIAGALTTGSDWADGLGTAFCKAAATDDMHRRLDLGCVLSHGAWQLDYDKGATPLPTVSVAEHAVVAFYLDLLRKLQEIGTVPAMDLDSWGDFLRYRDSH